MCHRAGHPDAAQVRRHVRDLSHPIIGDGEHGDTRVNRWWREEKQVNRLGLHCLSLDVPWWENAHGAEPALRLDPLAMRIAKPAQFTQT